MTLTQLRYLVAIADAGLNITLAAERVHATQPGISKQLKQLEDELGFQMFQRRGRSLDGVTVAGSKVIEHARRLLAEAANIRAYAANERGEDSGRLAIATTHTQARYVLPAALAALKRDYPQVDVDLFACGDAEVLRMLDRADVAIFSTAGVVPGGGVAVPLYRWKRVVVVRVDHPLAQLAQAPTLDELARHGLISYESSSREDSSLRQAFARSGITPQLAMTARDANLIKTYVRAGLGVGVLAEMAMEARDGVDLRVLPAPDALPQCMTWAVIPSGRVLRTYALDLVHDLAPQIDRHTLRQVLDGNRDADWPQAPQWAVDGQSTAG